MNVSGHTVLITGAGTGMGLEAARQLSARGNRVIMVARNEQRLRDEADRLDDAIPYACDITDASQVHDLFAFLDEEHPEMDVVLLNAGVTHTYRLFDSEDALAFAEVEMQTNYLAAIRFIEASVPRLERQDDPALIVTTSGAAFVPDITNPTYSATKAALHSLVLSVRLQLERNGSHIKVFDFMAPLVDSPFSAGVVSDQKMPAVTAIAELLAGLERDELELHVGLTAEIFQALRESSSDVALRAANAATGG